MDSQLIFLLETRDGAIHELQSYGAESVVEFGCGSNFFNRKGKFKGIDSLAIFRTSHAIIALELWHQAFEV